MIKKVIIIIIIILCSFQFAQSKSKDSTNLPIISLNAGCGVINPNSGDIKWKLNLNSFLKYNDDKFGFMLGYSTFKFAYKLDTKGVDELYDIKVNKEIPIDYSMLEMDITYGNSNIIPFAGVVYISGQNEIISGLAGQIGMLIKLTKDDNDTITGINGIAKFIFDNLNNSYIYAGINLSLKLHLKK